MDPLQQDARGRPGGRFASLDQRSVGLILLIGAMAAAAMLILWLERGDTYMSDEWGWVWYATYGSLGDMFHPLNQHLTVLPLFITKFSLSVWDTSIVPLRIAEVAGVLACGGAVYAFARPRVGPIVALAPAMVPMFLGTGNVILLQPLIGLQVLYAIAFGVAALVAADRGDRRGDVAAAILMTLSLASFSVGIAFLAGLTVAVVLAPNFRKRAYVFGVPLILYGAWRIWAMKYGSGGGPEVANIPAVPFYIVDSLATTTAALFGRASMIGSGPGTSLFLDGFTLDQATTTLVYATIECLVIVYLARKLARRGPIPVMLWATLAVLVALWTIQGLVLVAGRTPGEPRYIYPGAVALALVAVAAASRVRFGRLTIAVIIILTAVGILGNVPGFREGRTGIAYHAPRVYAYTGLMDLAGSNADPAFVPAYDTPEAATAGVLSISVGTYDSLASHYGPLGSTPAQILEESEEIRHGSDEVAVGMLHLHLEPIQTTRRTDCTDVQAGPDGGQWPLPRGGAAIRSDLTAPIFLRRFASDEWVELGSIERNRPAVLRIPPDSAKRPWVLGTTKRVTLRLCRP